MNLTTYIIIIAIFSLITFYSFYLDKSRANKNQWRIPLRSLIMLSFIFGSIGGLLSYLLGYKEKRLIILNFIAFSIQVFLGIFIYINFGI